MSSNDVAPIDNRLYRRLGIGKSWGFSTLFLTIPRVITAWRSLLLLPLLALLLGCAGYHLGPTNGESARERSIQVIPFMNQTLEPRLTDDVTFQLHKQLQQDGTYQLATHDPGDIVVSGT